MYNNLLKSGILMDDKILGGLKDEFEGKIIKRAYFMNRKVYMIDVEQNDGKIKRKLKFKGVKRPTDTYYENFKNRGVMQMK
jgi:hypothetical protein